MKKNSDQAFTLIEILITLSIMALIISISAFALNQARVSARDNKRKADLEFIRSGLEIYRSDCGAYPVSLPSPLVGDGSSTSCLSSNVYISQTPTDPQSGARSYSYTRLSPRRYALCASLEDPATTMVTTDCGSCTTACNYIVRSP